MAATRSFRLTEGQRTKLHQLAQALGRTPNYTLGQLIENAEVVIVPRQEVAATLQVQEKTNGKTNTGNLSG